MTSLQLSSSLFVHLQPVASDSRPGLDDDGLGCLLCIRHDRHASLQRHGKHLLGQEDVQEGYGKDSEVEGFMIQCHEWDIEDVRLGGAA